MLDVILVSNYSMKDELKESLQENDVNFYDLMIQDIQHIERYPIDDEYKTIIIQSANAIKKIDSSNNHIYNAEKIYGIGPNCRAWVSKKFSLDCTIPDNDYSSIGLIEKIEKENNALGKTLLLKGIGGKNIIKEYLDDRKINSRFLFGGNILWQPAYSNIEHREVGSLTNSNTVALSTFWLGVFPGLTSEMINYVIESINEFVRSRIR